MHMAIGAVVNAVWDLAAKRAGKPLWQLLADADTRMARLPGRLPLHRGRAHPRRGARPAARAAGRAPPSAPGCCSPSAASPAYTTSPGWLGYSDEKLTRLARQAVADGFTQIKLKVGADLADDVRRCRVARAVVGPRHPHRHRRQPALERRRGHRLDQGARRVRPVLDRGADQPRRRPRPRRDPQGRRPGQGRHRRARPEPHHLQAAAPGRRHRRPADRRGPRRRCQREPRDPAARGQVRRAGLPARGRRRPVRTRPAPVDVRLRGPRPAPPRTASSSTSTICTSTSSTRCVIGDGHYTGARRTRLLRHDAARVHRGVTPIPDGTFWAADLAGRTRSHSVSRHRTATAAWRLRGPQGPGDRRRVRHRPGHRRAPRRARRPASPCSTWTRTRRREAAARLSSPTSPTTSPCAPPWPPRSADLGGLDVLVNNAGIGAAGHRRGQRRRAVAPGPTTSTSSAWSARPAPPCRTCARSAHAAIVNTCSHRGDRRPAAARPVLARPRAPSYSLTLAMAADHVREGIRVNCVQPGHRRHPVGRPAARRGRRPGRRTRRPRGPPAHRPARHRRPKSRAPSPTWRARCPAPPPAPRSRSTAACRACACARRASEQRPAGAASRSPPGLRRRGDRQPVHRRRRRGRPRRPWTRPGTAGIRYFDTAPHYGLGLSERRLGAALRDRPRGEYIALHEGRTPPRARTRHRGRRRPRNGLRRARHAPPRLGLQRATACAAASRTASSGSASTASTSSTCTTRTTTREQAIREALPGAGASCARRASSARSASGMNQTAMLDPLRPRDGHRRRAAARAATRCSTRAALDGAAARGAGARASRRASAACSTPGCSPTRGPARRTTTRRPRGSCSTGPCEIEGGVRAARRPAACGRAGVRAWRTRPWRARWSASDHRSRYAIARRWPG